MKLGIALGGGGAKGFSHIGVLRALKAAGITPDIVTGTSAGSIIGALYAAGRSPDQIEQLMRRLTLRDWLARDHTGMGLFSTDGFRHIIEAELGADARIENLPRLFAAVAVEMESQEEVVFTAGSIADAVCASSAFPMVLAPASVGGKLHLDGGLVNPVPFDVARRLGADRVIAVDLSADEPMFTANTSSRRPGDLLFRFVFTAEQQAIFRVTTRAIAILTKSARTLKMNQGPPDVVIRPDMQQVGLIDYDQVALSVAAGELATAIALPQIQRMLVLSPWERIQAIWRK